MKNCSDCKYAFRTDTGYSNWTVEGTDLDCLKKLNPSFPDDNWYGESEAGKFAESCESFVEGDGPHFDVDMDMGDAENYSDDPEIKELIKAL